ncbi:unnamed protein product [Dicrocoelium dendriticum]|nr:unnamed protein product [Dicrocoelium dendriticum]
MLRKFLRKVNQFLNDRRLCMESELAWRKRQIPPRGNSFARILSSAIRSTFRTRHGAASNSSWDNVGLLIEPSPPLYIKDVLVTNDLTGSVLSEAIRKRINFILSYHPPVFNPLKRFTQDSWRERVVIQCLENRVAVFSPHTGLDAKKGGVNDWLISPFGMKPRLHFNFRVQRRRPRGYGRLATLSSRLKLSTVLDRYKKLLHVDHLTVALGDGKTFGEWFILRH